MNQKKKDCLGMIIVLMLSIVMIFFSKFIYKMNFLNDKVHRNLVYEKALVTKVDKELLQPDSKVPGIMLGYQDVEIEILKGEYKGKKFNIRNSVSRVYNIKVKEGMKVVAGIYKDKDEISDVAIYSYKRDGVVYFLIGIFFVLLIVIGKIKGIKSIVGLIFTGVTVMFFMLPLMFSGVNPIISAIITAIITTFVTMYLISGKSKKTLAAIIGTVLGVIAAGIISYVAGNVAHLSGITMENAENILYISENSGLKIKGLMFAAILIASLGAIMDIAMSIASSLCEIDSINKNLTKKQLFESGMNVGKDIIGTMSNTLILAFAGSSLNLLILLTAANMPYIQIANLDIVCTEIIQGLSGSIGLVLTVPITAFVSVFLIKNNKSEKERKYL